MKKTILSIALMGVFSAAFACGNNCAPQSFSTTNANSGVAAGTMSYAASSGNGAAYQLNAVSMEASTSVHADTDLNMPGRHSSGTSGSIDLNGTATTKGEALSVSLTKGDAFAAGLGGGTACATISAAGGYIVKGEDSQSALAAAKADSKTSVAAGTASMGNGAAIVDSVAGTQSGFDVDVDTKRDGAKLNKATVSTEVWSLSSKDIDTFRLGGGVIGPKMANTEGDAGAFANAVVGNGCKDVQSCGNRPR